MVDFLKDRFLSLGVAGGVVSAVAGIYLIKRWAKGGVCHSKAVLNGRTAIITGGNSGIGLETAVDLAKRGARVILACRSVERGERAVVEVRRRSGNQNVVFVQLDLASLTSIRAFAEKICQEEPQINILVNNAGLASSSIKTTEDGFEFTLGVNHLGPFLLTNLLLDKIKQSQSPRIVNVSSLAHKKAKINLDTLNSPEKGFAKYAQTKLANVLFTKSLAKRLEGHGVIATSLHPGAVRTNIWSTAPAFFYWIIRIIGLILFKSSWEGAQTTIHCAVCEEVVESMSGEYFSDCKIKKLENPQALDDDLAERLWQFSSKMVGLD